MFVIKSGHKVRVALELASIELGCVCSTIKTNQKGQAGPKDVDFMALLLLWV